MKHELNWDDRCRCLDREPRDCCWKYLWARTDPEYTRTDPVLVLYRGTRMETHNADATSTSILTLGECTRGGDPRVAIE